MQGVGDRREVAPALAWSCSLERSFLAWALRANSSVSGAKLNVPEFNTVINAAACAPRNSHGVGWLPVVRDPSRAPSIEQADWKMYI